MLASTKDELGNTTSFTYSTDFAGAYLTQTNLPDTQMPDTGAPLVHHQTSASYDYNTGLMTSATDENGNPFTYQYDTARLLLTQANHPDQGSTKYFYPNPTTVERQRAIDSSHYDDYFVHFDGLGRPIQTQQITPTCTVLVDTTYDAAGHVSTVSNPYWQGSSHATDPTYGVTQTQYDALGRVTRSVRPDSSVATVQYNNNCTIAIDESGRPRQACADAFGRVTEVGRRCRQDLDYSGRSFSRL
jgi:YD repeat-containing protein